jgi:hypothetical protein
MCLQFQKLPKITQLYFSFSELISFWICLPSLRIAISKRHDQDWFAGVKSVIYNLNFN